MTKLIKKNFNLCLHPTAILFLAFCTFVFIPNYPYEVLFFFAGLSAFFICLKARENGDLAFSCSLPVKKSQIAIARVLTTTILQCALLLLTALTVTLKQVLFSAENQINLAGNMANAAFPGYGALLLGIFNLIFFPSHFKNPTKVGVPFTLAATAQFVLIILLITLRWTVPFFSETLNTPDTVNLGAKLIVLAFGLVLYTLFTLLSAKLSARNFEKVDM